MMKLIFLIVVVVMVGAKYQRASHAYWYTAAKKTATTGVPYADISWNYCDLKCTYLENYYPDKDFVVMEFEEAAYKPNFAACYVQTSNGYALWNTVAKNSFFDDNCGGDSDDYASNSEYKIISKEGDGRGTPISYEK